jgi:arginyl-tRNA--protein-N-Asp/Glu arginylyltransferase
MAPLSLGKLTSLKEIEWVRELQGSCPSLRYYYLGFYIHNCHRMRYKVRAGGFHTAAANLALGTARAGRFTLHVHCNVCVTQSQ